MPYKNRKLVILLLVLLGISVLSVPVAAQQATSVPHMVELKDIGNATVTLYYYDNVTGKVGDMVPIPENPQKVNNDPSKGAMGFYTFYHVPSDQWYYVEADNNGSRWYALFYMPENIGTATHNVAIPPFSPLNDSANLTGIPSPSPLPTVTPTITPSLTPAPVTSSSPSPAPGLAFLPATMAFIIAITLAARKQ